MKHKIWKWVYLFMLTAIVASCGVDMPKEKQTSFETMTVGKGDIEVPVKYSAKMKGQADVTIMPQVSGQLMKILVTEGQQVSRGHVRSGQSAGRPGQSAGGSGPGEQRQVGV